MDVAAAAAVFTRAQPPAAHLVRVDGGVSAAARLLQLG